MVTSHADSHTLLHNLWPAIGANTRASSRRGSVEANAGRNRRPPSRRQRRRLPRRDAAAGRPPDVMARGELVPADAEEDAIEFSWVRQTARRVGTVVHEALERFAHGKLPAATICRRCARGSNRDCRRSDVDGAAAEAGADAR